MIYFCILMLYLISLGIILHRMKSIEMRQFSSVKEIGKSWLIDFIFYFMITFIYLLIESFLKSKILLYAGLIFIISSFLAKNVFFISLGFKITKIRITSSIKALLKNTYYLIILWII